MPISDLFHELGKIEKVQLGLFSRILIFNPFVNWEKLGKTAKDKNSKVPILNL